MSGILNKLSKPELAALISDYFRLDNDLISCIVHEQPFSSIHTEITAMLVEKKTEVSLLPQERLDLPSRVKAQILALAHGYVYGKEAGRVR